ncbi:MAG: DUF371 domain-containing protein [Promethearchaeota archaeon]|nr:MAG: DUF371 domain-containing protein [Candidatus Lokiarchaeota archaeon]
MRVLDEIYAYGHPNILCTHTTTIEITKDDELTVRGNCILGINASKACFDLSEDLKTQIWNQKKIWVKIETAQYKDQFFGFGNKDLLLLHKEDMVFRTSEFVCDRTILIRCSKSSANLDRDLINSLTISKKKVKISFLSED